MEGIISVLVLLRVRLVFGTPQSAARTERGSYRSAAGHGAWEQAGPVGSFLGSAAGLLFNFLPLFLLIGLNILANRGARGGGCRMSQ